MSFILDALRKLEETRTTGTTREILADRRVPPSPSVKKDVWLRLLTGALLLNAVMVAAWLLLRAGNEERVGMESQEGEKIPAVVKSISPEGDEKGETRPPASARSAEEVKPAEPLEERIDVDSPPLTVSGKHLPLPVATAAVAQDQPPVPGEPPPVPGDPPPVPGNPPPVSGDQPPVSGDPPRMPEGRDGSVSRSLDGDPGDVPVEHPAADKLYRFEDLPPDMRQALDDLRISGHVYSDDPSFRLVNVGDLMKREGDSVSTEIRLVEITEGGAIFTYRGYRFFKAL